MRDRLTYHIILITVKHLQSICFDKP